MKRFYFRALSLFLLLGSLQAYADLAVTISVNSGNCTYPYGNMSANVTGGLPPYDFSWSPGNPSGQGTATISGLFPGVYTVTVTDSQGTTVQASGEVMPPGGLNEPQYGQFLPGCDNPCGATIQVMESSLGGVPPYSYSVITGGSQNGATTIGGICADGTGITITDAIGCQVSFVAYGTSYPLSPGPLILTAVPACGGQANGSVTVGPNYGQAWYRVHNATFDNVYAFNVGPYTIGGLPAGEYNVGLWDPSDPLGMGTGDGWWVYCTETSTFTVPSLPGPCGSIAGRMYHDADADCVFNGFDIGLPYRVLSIEPGDQYAITDGNGHYQRNLDLGAYTIQQATMPDEVAVCPVSGPASFVLDNATPLDTVDFANLSTVPHDLSVTLNSTSARPGFGTMVWMTVVNHSAFPSGQVDVTLSYDPLLLNPSNAAWSLPALGPYGAVTYSFTANVPADIGLLGTVLNYGVTVTNTISEANTANNTALHDVTITASYDPNDKLGRTSSGASDQYYFLDADDHIDYTVRFQNTGTAAAETVVIRDVIDTDLELTSIEILGASHPFTPSFGEGRELVFTFADIDLPDSTSDLLGSQGFISYRMKPVNTIAAGTLIENTANIYFDFNPPVITAPSVLVAEFSTGSEDRNTQKLRIAPNPASDQLTVWHLTENMIGGNLRVVGVDGRAVVNTPITNDRMVLDLSTFSAGLYVLQVRDIDQRMHHTNFVISR